MKLKEHSDKFQRKFKKFKRKDPIACSKNPSERKNIKISRSYNGVVSLPQIKQKLKLFQNFYQCVLLTKSPLLIILLIKNKFSHSMSMERDWSAFYGVRLGKIFCPLLRWCRIHIFYRGWYSIWQLLVLFGSWVPFFIYHRSD